MTSYSVIGPDGRAYGPADEVMLAQWAREGRLTAQTLVRCERTGAHRAAQTIPAIAPLLGLPPEMVNELVHAPLHQHPLPQGQPLPYAQPLPYQQPYVVAPGAHGLDAFSTPLTILLHYVTFGIFSWIHFGLMHDRMPRVRQDDPSSTKAICFYLIPFFNLYWMFFENIRLCDRINEQRRAVGLPETAPRGMAIAYAAVMLIPYFNILVAFPILGPIYLGLLRQSVNELVDATHGRA